MIAAELYPAIAEVASRPGFTDWLAQVRTTGGCAQPIHLYGSSQTLHMATGQILSERTEGRLLVACGNRRKTRCPSCSETYRADTYQLIRAGLLGGKTVPDTVAGHPRIFATFTAPSFGPVHHRPLTPAGQARPCHPNGPHACGRVHAADDPMVGQPLDPDTYDYVAAVTWNALATRLWARTVQLANRKAAQLFGVRQRDWKHIGRVSVAKVAEYQARGLVHFHAIFRLDGPTPDHPLPAGATAEILAEAITRAARLAAIERPDSPALIGMEPIMWGDQLDLRPIVSTETDDRQTLTDGQVAGYLAKYATKGTEAAGAVDRTIACRTCAGQGRHHAESGTDWCVRCKGTGAVHPIVELVVTPHARRMIQTCWELGSHPELAHLRLRPWAHMLGFRGHFSTKSRHYSTTLTRLRRARQDWQDDHTRRAHGLDPATPFRRVVAHQVDKLDHQHDEEIVVVIGYWAYTGRGHTDGEAVFAASVAADKADNRRIRRQMEGRTDAY